MKSWSDINKAYAALQDLLKSRFVSPWTRRKIKNAMRELSQEAAVKAIAEPISSDPIPEGETKPDKAA